MRITLESQVRSIILLQLYFSIEKIQNGEILLAIFPACNPNKGSHSDFYVT